IRSPPSKSCLKLSPHERRLYTQNYFESQSVRKQFCNTLLRITQVIVLKFVYCRPAERILQDKPIVQSMNSFILYWR
ncbi:hypothetical protein BgiBS90_009961, partial [Biomphalaria glabrata]